ncbi:hypothetical protein ACE6H2_014352 [Prunus campanulata]
MARCSLTLTVFIIFSILIWSTCACGARGTDTLKQGETPDYSSFLVSANGKFTLITITRSIPSYHKSQGEKQQHTHENNQGTKDQALARGQLTRPTTCQAVLDMDDEAEEYSF